MIFFFGYITLQQSCNKLDLPFSSLRSKNTILERNLQQKIMKVFQHLKMTGSKIEKHSGTEENRQW